MRTITSSVSAASVNECPDPATRSERPAPALLRTTSISSSRLRGRSTVAGLQAWSPTQLRQLCAPASGRLAVVAMPQSLKRSYLRRG